MQAILSEALPLTAIPKWVKQKWAKEFTLIYVKAPRLKKQCHNLSSSSSDTSAGQRFQPHNRTLEVGSLEWVVESTTVTHSSADWWDILLPLA